jgi:hypothetical protein
MLAYVVHEGESCAIGRDVAVMLWVDHENYFGPDRRKNSGDLRIFERRRENCAGPPPPLGTALRQFRMRVIEACGRSGDAFIGRAYGLAQLAELQDEPDTAIALARLARLAERARERNSDVRPALYDGLDQVETTLRVYH